MRPNWSLVLVLLIVPALSRQLSDELKAWVPWLIKRLIRPAVRRLPDDQQEDIAAAWNDHINEVPVDIGKVVVAACISRERPHQLRREGG